jgi:hypothetical protein
MKALVLSLLVAAALWWSYQAGQNEVTIECQNRMASLSAQSEASRIANEDKINDLETKRVKDEQIASERSRLRAERLRASKPSISDTPDNPACRIAPDAYVVLRESASDTRLSEAPDPASAVSPAVPAPDAGQ